MTPEARLSAAADILDALDRTRPVEPQLKAWARGNRYAGSKDRKAIADRVYSCLRRLRSSAVAGGGEAGRHLVFGALRVEDGLNAQEIVQLCKGQYGLAPPDDGELAVLSALPAFPSDASRLDWPDWLYQQAVDAFGQAVDAELDALRGRAPLDLRVNTLKSSVSEAIRALEEGGLSAKPVELCQTAIRMKSGSPLKRSRAYTEGLVEPQDAASQAASAFAQARPGDSVLDYCAGGGGKALALAAMMENRGRLVVHDIDRARMTDIAPRAARAGATIIEEMPLATLGLASCDVVFVDAPCSGSGSWRRDPPGKWGLTPHRLDELRNAQREAMASAARYVRPGGVLVYATCSVLPTENRDQVSHFTQNLAGFNLEEIRDFWPGRDDTDGFFTARFRRLADSAVD